MKLYIKEKNCVLLSRHTNNMCKILSCVAMLAVKVHAIFNIFFHIFRLLVKSTECPKLDLQRSKMSAWILWLSISNFVMDLKPEKKQSFSHASDSLCLFMFPASEDSNIHLDPEKRRQCEARTTSILMKVRPGFIYLIWLKKFWRRKIILMHLK